MPSQATSPLSVASAIVACTEEAALSTTFVKINPIAGSNAVALALSATRSVQSLLKNCAHIWPRHLMYAMAAAYVCNGCGKEHLCTLKKRYYLHSRAQNSYNLNSLKF